jgi:hypothetical protein
MKTLPINRIIAIAAHWGGIYVYREILDTFHVSIKGIDKSTTAVTITADYRAALWDGNTFKGWVRCQSKGFVEKTFFQMLSSFFKVKPAETDQPNDNGERRTVSTRNTLIKKRLRGLSL